jgi:hypothetical protein
MADGDRKKSFLETVQAVATIGAIVAGGLWTYLLFIQQRQQYPHVKFEHHVSHQALPGHRLLLMVDITDSNVGTVKASLTSGDLKIYNLEPRDLSDQEINQINSGTQSGGEEPNALWSIVARRILTWKADENVVEPGEMDQLHYEFIVSDDVGPLIIYSYFKNPMITERELGWVTRSIYDPHKRAESEVRAR